MSHHPQSRPPATRGLDLRSLDLHLAHSADDAAGTGTNGAAAGAAGDLAVAPSASPGIFGFPDGEGGGGEAAGRAAASRIGARMTRGVYELRRGVLAVHELRRGGHRQVGLVAGVTVADIRRGGIRAHEQTQTDRVRRMAAFLGAARLDVSPVLLAYRMPTDLDALLAEAVDRAADVVVSGTGPTRHRIWVVEEGSLLERVRLAARGIRRVTVVDGHHRIAAALDGAADGPVRGGRRVESTLLAELVPDRDLRMVGFDRLVHLDAPAAGRALLDDLAKVADVTELGSVPPGHRPDGAFEVFAAVPGRWVRAVFRDPPSEVPDSLPVSLLQDRLLRPALGLTDPRTDGRLEYLPGMGDLRRLDRMVRGSGAIAFVPRAVSVEELQAVVARGGVLPPKSTYLTTKTEPGIIVRRHDPVESGA